MAGEFDGVVEQVGQALLQAFGVTAHGVGHIIGRLELKAQAFLFGQGPHQRAQAGQQIGQREGLAVHIKPSGLNFGQVEQVVNEGFKALPRLAEHLHMAALRGSEWGLTQQFGHAKQGVHRGANFMAHIGQKIALGLVGCQRLDAVKLKVALRQRQGALARYDRGNQASRQGGQGRCDDGGRVTKQQQRCHQPRHGQCGKPGQQGMLANGRAAASPGSPRRAERQHHQRSLRPSGFYIEQAARLQRFKGVRQDRGATRLSVDGHGAVGQQRAAADEHHAALHGLRQLGGTFQTQSGTCQFGKWQHQNKTLRPRKRHTDATLCVRRPRHFRPCLGLGLGLGRG